MQHEIYITSLERLRTFQLVALQMYCVMQQCLNIASTNGKASEIR